MNVKDKSRLRIVAAWFREISTNEPLMRYRNIIDDVRTGVLSWFQDKPRGNLLKLKRSSNSLCWLEVERLQGNDWHEPDELRGSRTVLWGTGGEIFPVCRAH